MTTTVDPATGQDWNDLVGLSMTVLVGAMGPHVAKHARRWAVAKARTWGVSAEGIDNVALVLSELVTNAWTHTHSRTGLIVVHLLQACGGAVRVEVRDEGRADGAAPALVRQLDDHAPLAGVDATHGRGLCLVQEFSTEWGVQPHRVHHGSCGVPRVGHTVWACPRGARVT